MITIPTLQKISSRGMINSWPKEEPPLVQKRNQDVRTRPGKDWRLKERCWLKKPLAKSFKIINSNICLYVILIKSKDYYFSFYKYYYA